MSIFNVQNVTEKENALFPSVQEIFGDDAHEKVKSTATILDSIVNVTEHQWSMEKDQSNIDDNLALSKEPQWSKEMDQSNFKDNVAKPLDSDKLNNANDEKSLPVRKILYAVNLTLFGHIELDKLCVN